MQFFAGGRTFLFHPFGIDKRFNGKNEYFQPNIIEDKGVLSVVIIDDV